MASNGTTISIYESNFLFARRGQLEDLKPVMLILVLVLKDQI